MNEESMTETPAETDEELLLRMRSGDEQAFGSLYRRRQAAIPRCARQTHRRQAAIYRFALHMSGSAAAAEDVIQEVFLALIRDDCGYDPERGTLSGYLFGIARKLVLRQLERRRTDVALDTDGDDSVLPEMTASADQLPGLTRKEGIAALRRAVELIFQCQGNV